MLSNVNNVIRACTCQECARTGTAAEKQPVAKTEPGEASSRSD